MVCDVEAGLVLRVVAVEEERGLVGGAEERLGDQRPTEAVDDRAGLQRAAADLQVVVDGLGGEVEELQVDTWWRGGSFIMWFWVECKWVIYFLFF